MEGEPGKRAAGETVGLLRREAGGRDVRGRSGRREGEERAGEGAVHLVLVYQHILLHQLIPPYQCIPLYQHVLLHNICDLFNSPEICLKTLTWSYLRLQTSPNTICGTSLVTANDKVSIAS